MLDWTVWLSFANPTAFSLSPSAPSRHDSGDRSGGISPPTAQKKSTTRRNAWGNMSYADLITQAILSSPEKRLTLSQGSLSYAKALTDSHVNPNIWRPIRPICCG